MSSLEQTVSYSFNEPFPFLTHHKQHHLSGSFTYLCQINNDKYNFDILPSSTTHLIHHLF